MSSSLGRVWRRWIKVTTIIGNIQMTILLTLVYWTIVTLTAIPFRFLADPLSLRRSSRNCGWRKREPIADMRKSMRKQG